MTSMNTHAKIFVVNNDDLLIVSRHDGNHATVMCCLRMDIGVSFVIKNERYIETFNKYGSLIRTPLVLESADEAQSLISQLTDAQIAFEKRMRSRNRVRQVLWVAAAVALVAGVAWYWSAQDKSEPKSLVTNPAYLQQVAAAPTPASQPAAQPVIVAAASPEDGWAVPTEVRKVLAENLGKAAARLALTINYSSGHSRSLFVFADPNCPNCQNLEPALREASKSFNVVVFPVSVIGGEKSAELIRPILCLAPEKRAAAWEALFDVGRDGLNIGKSDTANVGIESGNCEFAQKVLDANHAAWKAYLIPGTPWVIADDGRHVPQALVRNPEQLQVFLDAKDPTHEAR